MLVKSVLIEKIEIKMKIDILSDLHFDNYFYKNIKKGVKYDTYTN